MIESQLDVPSPSQVSKGTLRSFAALCLGVFGILFCLSWYRHAGEPTLAGWLSLVVAVLVGVPGLISPSVVRPVFSTAIMVTHPIGRVMNVLLLGTLYYGVVTPIAVVFRLAGRDVLRRRRPPTSTHWVAKHHNTDVSRYLRQYQRQ